MAVVNNRLTLKEQLTVIELVKTGIKGAPFSNWKECELAIGQLLGRKVKRKNIEFCIEQSGVDAELVKPADTPFARVWRKISDLEKRVEALEEIIN